MSYHTMPKLPIAVQLYTLRDQTAKDFPGILKQVAQIGYSGVELAGYGNLKSVRDARKALDDANLRVCGSHIAIEALESDLEAILDQNEELGNKNLVCPYLSDNRRNSTDAWLATAKSLNAIAQACQARAFDFAYHNHSFEFQKFDSTTGMDLLWQHTDPQVVKAEIDAYWVEHAGLNAAQYIESLGRRVMLVHLKDMSPPPERRFAEVGTGTLDFPSIIAAARKSRAEWLIVEQDDCYGRDPIQCLRTSFENLKKLGLA
jgi:sugar phosphate isomerase/epimerase